MSKELKFLKSSFVFLGSPGHSAILHLIPEKVFLLDSFFLQKGPDGFLIALWFSKSVVPRFFAISRRWRVTESFGIVVLQASLTMSHAWNHFSAVSASSWERAWIPRSFKTEVVLQQRFRRFQHGKDLLADKLGNFLFQMQAGIHVFCKVFAWPWTGFKPKTLGPFQNSVSVHDEARRQDHRILHQMKKIWDRQDALAPLLRDRCLPIETWCSWVSFFEHVFLGWLQSIWL